MTIQFPRTPPLEHDLTPDELRDARERDEYRARNAREQRALDRMAQLEQSPEMLEVEKTSERIAAAVLSSYRNADKARIAVATVAMRVHGASEPVDLGELEQIALAAEVCALRAELDTLQDDRAVVAEVCEQLQSEITELHAELELERDNNTKVAEQNDQLELMLTTRATVPQDCKDPACPGCWRPACVGADLCDVPAKGNRALSLLELGMRDGARIISGAATVEQIAAERYADPGFLDAPPLTNIQRARLWAWNAKHREAPHADNLPNFASLDESELGQIATILAERNMHLVVDDGLTYYACNNVEQCEPYEKRKTRRAHSNPEIGSPAELRRGNTTGGSK